MPDIVPTIILKLDCSHIGCCTEKDSSMNEVNALSELSANKLDIFRSFPIGSLKATTITIGRKWIGRLSDKEQYRIIKNKIKRMILESRRHGNKDSLYYYIFEYQRNGQLHAHGIEYDTYRRFFDEQFADIGKHNLSNQAFTAVRNTKEYIKYMLKEQDRKHTQRFPHIHNITKKYMKEHLRRERAINESDDREGRKDAEEELKLSERTPTTHILL